MIRKDCTKAAKKNAFTSGCKNFQRSALVPRMSQVDHKRSTKVLIRQKKFKAAIKLSEKYDSNLPVTLSHNNNTNNFLGGEGGRRVAKILGPTQNAWDPNLTRHASTRTQNEKS